MNKILDWAIILYLPLTGWTQGIGAGGATVTGAAFAAVVGVALILLRRFLEERPPISWQVLKQPPVFSAIAYMLAGIASGYFAADKDPYTKEVIQRALIILLPMYLYIYGPRNSIVLRRTLVLYIANGALMAALAFAFGLKSGLHAPVYLFGMHKNAVGATCGQTGLACVAFLLSGRSRKHHLLLMGLIALSFLGMVATQARAAMSGFVIGIFLMMLVSKVRLRYLVAAGGTVIILLAAMTFLLPKEQIEHAVSTKKFSSNAERQVVWNLMWRKLSNDPFLVVGWGNPLPLGHESYVGDAASIFYYDWAQMGLLGLFAQWAMFGTSLWAAYLNSRDLPRYSTLAIVNLTALGIMQARFMQSYLDTFWIGRGPTLSAWAAVGMAVFIRLWLLQQKEHDWFNQKPILPRPRHTAAILSQPAGTGSDSFEQ